MKNQLEEICFWKIVANDTRKHNEILDYCQTECDGNNKDCQRYASYHPTQQEWEDFIWKPTDLVAQREELKENLEQRR